MSRFCMHLSLQPEGAKSCNAGAEQNKLRQMAQLILRRIAKGLQPGSLSQKKIDLLEKTSSSRFVPQKKVVPPGKRYEASAGDPSRHLTARIYRGRKITAHMHDKRWNLHLREQFAHIEISDDFEVASSAFG